MNDDAADFVDKDAALESDDQTLINTILARSAERPVAVALDEL